MRAEEITWDFDGIKRKNLPEEINKPMRVITEKWNPSVCPRCLEDFSDCEPCNDGYYTRVMVLERCPYCGQKLDWSNA